MVNVVQLYFRKMFRKMRHREMALGFSPAPQHGLWDNLDTSAHPQTTG